MKYRTRTYYSAEQKAEMWDRWQKGESIETREIFDLSSAVDFAAGFFVPLAENCRLAA
jgi:hypothetical protein